MTTTLDLTPTITAPEATGEQVMEVLAPTLGDLIRWGSVITEPCTGFGDGETKACALGAAYLGAKHFGLAD